MLLDIEQQILKTLLTAKPDGPDSMNRLPFESKNQPCFLCDNCSCADPYAREIVSHFTGLSRLTDARNIRGRFPVTFRITCGFGSFGSSRFLTERHVDAAPSPANTTV